MSVRPASIRPPLLRSGDAISIIAPAGPVPRDTFEKGAAILKSRYRLVHDERIFERQGYLAGTDEFRLIELEHALGDPSTQAVMLARGGYGITRLLDRLSPTCFLDRPKMVIGFSDATALHGWLTKLGTTSIHGPVVTQLGLLPHDQAMRELTTLSQLLESGDLPAPIVGLKSHGRDATVEGVLRGGNLEVLSRLLGTNYQVDLDGAILLIEEVGERPYRIDRILTQLQMAGEFAHLRGVIVGDLIHCVEKDGSGPTAQEVIVECLRPLSIPILTGAPIGHGERNRAIPLNVAVRLDASNGTLTFV